MANELPVGSIAYVRTDGASTNGGGYHPDYLGATGINYSDQATAQFTYVNLTGNSSNTIISSSNFLVDPNFTDAMVGNFVHISSTAGGFIVGYYLIVFFISSTQVQLDRTCASSGASSGGAMKIGGSLGTVAAAIPALLNGASIKFEPGTYNVSSAVIDTTSISYAYWKRMYADVGDEVILKWTGAINSRMFGYSFAGTTFNLMSIENITFDGNSTAGCWFADTTTLTKSFFLNCTFKNWAKYVGIFQAAKLIQCVFNNCGSTPASGFHGAVQLDGSLAYRNYFTGNVGTPIYVSDNSNELVQSVIDNNAIWGNTGASTNGIQLGQSSDTNYSHVTVVKNNVIHSNGASGIYIDEEQTGYLISKNIMSSNTRYGIETRSALTPIYYPFIKCNSFYSNSLGDVSSNVQSQAIQGSLTLTSLPYNATDGTDWGLNNAPGGGLAIKNADACYGTLVGAYSSTNVYSFEEPLGGLDICECDTPSAGVTPPTGPETDVDVQYTFNTAVAWFADNRYYLSVGGTTLCYDFETDGWTDCGYGYVNCAITVNRYTFPTMTFLGANWENPVVGDMPTVVSSVDFKGDNADPTAQTNWRKRIRFRAMDGAGFPRNRIKKAALSRNWGSMVVPPGLETQGTVSMITENGYVESYPIQVGQYENQYLCYQEWSSSAKGALLMLELDFDERVNPTLSDYCLDYVPDN